MWERPEYQTRFYRCWRHAAEKGRSMPPTPHFNELADCIAAAIQDILLQHADVPKTLKQAQDEYNARFAQL
jgi:maltose-binding protein MalE